jgi:hypothetical protein
MLDSKFIKKNKKKRKNLKYFNEILNSTFIWYLHYSNRFQEKMNLDSIPIKLLNIYEILINETKSNEELIHFKGLITENILKSLLFTPTHFSIQVKIQTFKIFKKLFLNVDLLDLILKEDKMILFFRISEFLPLKHSLVGNSLQIFNFTNLILNFYSHTLVHSNQFPIIKIHDQFDTLIKNLIIYLENELTRDVNLEMEELDEVKLIEMKREYFLIQKVLNLLSYFSCQMDLKDYTDNDFDLNSIHSLLKNHKQYLKNFEFLK